MNRKILEPTPAKDDRDLLPIAQIWQGIILGVGLAMLSGAAISRPTSETHLALRTRPERASAGRQIQ